MSRRHLYLLCGAVMVSLVVILCTLISTESEVSRVKPLPQPNVRHAVDYEPLCPTCPSNTSTQTSRQHTLRRSCSSLYKDSLHTDRVPRLFYTQNIRVSEKYRTFFCLVPKAGSSSLGGTMLVLDGHLNSTAGMATQEIVQALKASVKSFQHYDDEARLTMLRNFTAIIFVRNPYTRLLSAFRDRLETYPNRLLYHRRLHSKKIYTMFGNHSKDESPGPSVKSELYNVTFKEFVDYYLSGTKDIHWNEQHNVCPPCVRYDYIGKMETFAEDYNEVLKLIGAESKIPLIKALHTTRSSDNVVLKEYYDTLMDEQLQKLHKVLATDMMLYGYTVPDEIKRL